MSREAISRDLYSLVPGWTSALPADLVNLTSSLLAQSRSKAGNLKKDEEIARGYVCANIACERSTQMKHACLENALLTRWCRLKRTLDLPDITPRPPVASRTYKKVYQYLDTALKATVSKQQQQTNGNSAPSTPSKARKHASTTNTPASNRTAARHTPLKSNKATLPHRSLSKKLHSSQTPRSANKDGRQAAAAAAAISYITAKTPDLDFPPWTMQSIRSICTAWSQPQAAPHIFAGVSSVARHLARQSLAATPSSSSYKSSAHKRPKATARQSAAAAGAGEVKDGKFPARLLAPLTFTIAIYTDTQFGSAPANQGEYARKRAEVYAIFDRFTSNHSTTTATHRARASSESDEEADEPSHTDNDDGDGKGKREGWMMMRQDEYERVCEEYNALADREWLGMEWYANVCEAAQALKSQLGSDYGSSSEDGNEEEEAEGAMDVDQPSDAGDTSSRPSRKKGRSRVVRAPAAGDDIDEDGSMHQSKRHKTSSGISRQQVETQRGGEMMLARVGWLDSAGNDDMKQYEKWAAGARRRIADKRREMGVSA